MHARQKRLAAVVAALALLTVVVTLIPKPSSALAAPGGADAPAPVRGPVEPNTSLADVTLGSIRAPAAAPDASASVGEALRVVTVVPRPYAEAWGAFEVVVRSDVGEQTVHALADEEAELLVESRGPLTVVVRRAGWLDAVRTVDAKEDRTRLDVEVEPVRAVVGRVVAGEDGRPITAFDLTVEARVSGERGEYVVTSSGARIRSLDGAFTAAEETDGVVAERVRVEAEGFVPRTSDWIRFDGGLVAVPEIELHRMDEIVVHGLVRSDSGATVAGATVSVWPGESQPRLLRVGADTTFGAAEDDATLDRDLLTPNGRPLVEATSDAAGAFVLALPRGVTGRLAAVIGGHAAVIGEPISFDAASAAPLTLRLPALRPLEIQVVQGPHAARVVALDRILVEQGSHRVVAELEGVSDGSPRVTKYRADVRPDGGGVIRVLGRRAGGAVKGFATIEVASRTWSGPAPPSIEVHQGHAPDGASVATRFALPDGIDPAATVVAAFADDGRPEQRTYVDADGRAAFAGLGAGEWTIALMGHGPSAVSVALWTRRVAIGDAENVDLGRIDLASGGRVTLTGADGGLWSLEDEAGAVSPFADEVIVRSDERGRLVVHGLDPGDYVVRRMGRTSRWGFQRSAAAVETVELEPLR